MRILIAHNRYKNLGGETVAANAEIGLLKDHGHAVDVLEADNAQIAGLTREFKAALEAPYSSARKRCMAARIAEFKPDLVHVHNFFPLLSPAIYYACNEARVPIVQTLHNYRIICPSALLFRSGRPCEDCVGKVFAWPGVLHACYRGSRLGTASVAAMAGAHHWLGTWRNRIDCFIALTNFSRRKLIEGGLPAHKIVVKPNFAPDPERARGGQKGFAFFAGRLSLEKGILTVLSAWKQSDNAVPLKIAGDGPLKNEVIRRATDERVQYLGALSRDRVQELMCEASFLVFPSLCYENFPLSIVEAFACGLPVIASRLGAMEEIVEDQRTGLHFRPGDAQDLAAKIDWVVNHPADTALMRQEARAEYLVKYTPERNLDLLMQIYGRVIEAKRRTAVLPRTRDRELSDAANIIQ